MTARCEDCGRRLKRPSPDGLGRKCRRKRRAATEPARTDAGTSQRPLDHAALAAAGQLTIPIQQALAVAVPSRRRGRRVIDVPGPDTWTEETA